VNEALRLYPPGWLLSRRTIEADVLAVTRCRRAPTCCCAYLLHRHPGFWEDRSFSPERFAPSMKRASRFATCLRRGPRHCIGETLYRCMSSRRGRGLADAVAGARGEGHVGKARTLGFMLGAKRSGEKASGSSQNPG